MPPSTIVKWRSVLINPTTSQLKVQRKAKGRTCQTMRTQPSRKFYTGRYMLVYVQTDSPQKIPTKKKGIPVRRNPGRNSDKHQWKSKSFVCRGLRHELADGGVFMEGDREEDEWPRDEYALQPHDCHREISLLDIARPAKPKPTRKPLPGYLQSPKIIHPRTIPIPIPIPDDDDLFEFDLGSESWSEVSVPSSDSDWEDWSIYALSLDGGESQMQGGLRTSRSEKKTYSEVVRGT